MKVKSKGELRNEIEELQKVNRELCEKMNAEQKEIWNKRLPEAKQVFYIHIRKMFGNMVCSVRYEHVDESGYWFTFKLVNDSRTQTYCVRHQDLQTTK